MIDKRPVSLVLNEHLKTSFDFPRAAPLVVCVQEPNNSGPLHTQLERASGFRIRALWKVRRRRASSLSASNELLCTYCPKGARAFADQMLLASAARGIAQVE